jgi:hypothetical protein
VVAQPLNTIYDVEFPPSFAHPPVDHFNYQPPVDLIEEGMGLDWDDQINRVTSGGMPLTPFPESCANDKSVIPTRCGSGPGIAVYNATHNAD